jgi:aspartyl-tRNA(Asn)/glutamyl-tRNA(Gln) amidotransferase subunit C
VPVGKEEIRKVARLAHLELTPKELEKLSKELARIIGYIDQIKSIDTSGIVPRSQNLKTENVLREDKAKPSLPKEKALANAPDKDDDFFKVPKVLG